MNPVIASESKTAGSPLLAASLPARDLITQQAVVLASAIEKVYLDKRPGFGPHKAIDFNVTLNNPINISMLLVELLGNDASVLIHDWSTRLDCSQQAPVDNKVVLFSESNFRARNANDPKRGVRTTLQDDFEGAELKGADDLQATIICATLVRKAKDAGLDLRKDAYTWASEQSEALGKLNSFEVNLLTKLRDGIVRTSSGALNIFAKGRLRANYFFRANSHADYWVFNGSAPEELN